MGNLKCNPFILGLYWKGVLLESSSSSTGCSYDDTWMCVLWFILLFLFFFWNWKPYFNSSAVYVLLSSSWLCIKASNLLAMSFLLSFLISEGDQMSDFDCWPVFNFFCLVANSLFECLFWQVIWRQITGPRCHLSIYCDISLYKGVSASSGVRNNLWNKSTGLKIYRRAF